MPDFFDSAGAANDKTKAALLASIAQNGSQARAAFEQAQAQIQAQRAQAIAAAVAESAQRGAPQGVVDENSATIASGYDRRLADLASAQASNAGSLASISSQGGSYLDQASAAIPGLRARQQLANTTAATSQANRLATLKAQQDERIRSQDREQTQFEQTLADRKAQRDYEATQRELDRQYNIDKAAQDATDRTTRNTQQQRIDDLQLQIAQANLGKAEAGASGQQDKAAVKQHEQDALAGRVAPATTKEIASLGKSATTLAKPGQIAAGANYALPGAGATNIATAAANRPGPAAFQPPPAPKLTSKEQSDITKSKEYKAIVAKIAEGRAAGASLVEIADVVTTTWGATKPKTVALALSTMR